MTLGTAFAVVALTSQVVAETTHYPAPGEGAQELVIYSTLDSRLASTLIEAFQASHTDVAVRYEDLQIGRAHV